MMVKNFRLGVSVVLIVCFLVLNAFATLCCDGTISQSSGKGTCSHHGGVCESGSSSTLCIKPPAPYGVDASDGEYEDRIKVRWAEVTDAEYYKIYVASNGQKYALIATSYNSPYIYHTRDPQNKRFKIVACNSCGCSAPAVDSGYIQAREDTLPCSALEVIDGDTLEYRQKKFRLYGIDAPESYEGRKMEYDANRCGVSTNMIEEAGYLAKSFLSTLLSSIEGMCQIQSRYKDRYDREVVLIILPNRESLNQTLIAQGYAIAWDHYIQEEDRKALWHAKEKEAALEGRGLWQEYCPLMSCLADHIASCSSEEANENAQDSIKEIEKIVLSEQNGTYAITGYFAPYHFGEDPKSNWTFTFASSHTTYRLLGDTSEENIKRMGIFGWVRVDVRPNPPAFYMVHYRPGKFDWLIFNLDSDKRCKHIYKLVGQDPQTKAFSYDIDGDGKADRLDGLGCELITKERVRFFHKMP